MTLRYCFNLHLLDYNFPTCLFTLFSYMKSLFMTFLHMAVLLSCFSLHPPFFLIVVKYT